jgi:uncharacterized membrane protein YdjX (TVP38/TMEM64 family)
MPLISKIKEKLREFGKLTPMALLMAVLPMSGSFILVLVGYPLGMWLRENWQAGSVAFTIGVIIFCGVSLIPTNLIGVLGGWAFGFGFGLFLLMIGITGAAYISFLINRRIAGNRLPEIAEKYPRAEAIYDELVREDQGRATLVVFLLRASIIMPFAFTNFLLASARVSSISFIIGTFFGMLPRSAVTVFVGAGLSTLVLDAASQPWVIIPGFAASVVMIVVLAFLSRRALMKMTAKRNETDG